PHRLHQRLANLLVGYLDNLGHARNEVAALDLHGLNLVAGIGRPDRYLDQLGSALADEQIVLALDVLDDRFIHLVARDPHRARKDDASQRNDGDLGGAAADIDNHVAGRLGNWQPGADRSRHRLFNQVNLARARRLGRFAHGALLDRGDAERHADDDTRARTHERLARVNLLDEVAQHVLGDLEVGYDAVLERPDGDDRARRAAEHLLRLGSDREHAPRAARIFLHRDHRRLVAHDAFALHIDEGVGGAEIDCQIVGEPTEN